MAHGDAVPPPLTGPALDELATVAVGTAPDGDGDCVPLPDRLPVGDVERQMVVETVRVSCGDADTVTVLEALGVTLGLPDSDGDALALALDDKETRDDAVRTTVDDGERDVEGDTVRVGTRDGDDVVEPESEFRALVLTHAVVEPERLGVLLADDEPVRVGAATVPLTVGQRDGDDDTLRDCVAVPDVVDTRLSIGCPDTVTETVAVLFGLALVEAEERGDVEPVTDVDDVRVCVAHDDAVALCDAVLHMLVVGDTVVVDTNDAAGEPVGEPQNDALSVAEVEADGVSEGVRDTQPVDETVPETVAQPVPELDTVLVGDIVDDTVDVKLVE